MHIYKTRTERRVSIWQNSNKTTHKNYVLKFCRKYIIMLLITMKLDQSSYKITQLFIMILQYLSLTEGSKIARWRGKLSSDARTDFIFPGK